MASATTASVIDSLTTSVLRAASPVSVTGTSTWTFSPRFTISRSTCSNVSLIGSRWIALGSASVVPDAADDVDRENLVEPAVPDRGRELPGRQRDVLRLLAVAVQHGGHQTGPARAAGTTLAELGAGLGADLYLGHGETPETLRSGCV